MLIPASAWSALVQAGVLVRPLGPRVVEVQVAEEGQAVRLRVHQRSEPLSPSHVTALLATGVADQHHAGLIIAPSASASAVQTAYASGWSVIALNARERTGPTGRVVIGPRVVDLGVEAAPSPTTVARSGPRPWGSLAVARRLLDGGGWTQRQLAERAAVSQPLVSSTLKTLSSAGWLSQTTRGREVVWSAEAWDELLDWWLSTYPGPGGIATYWYGLDPARDQARNIASHLRQTQSRVAVSGDVAADEVAPWRRPSRAIVYTTAVVDRPERLGLTPCGAEEATLELIVPEDPGAWGAAGDLAPAVGLRGSTADLPLADPVQVVWDVGRSTGPDADQAVEALREVLRSRALDGDGTLGTTP